MGPLMNYILEATPLVIGLVDIIAAQGHVGYLLSRTVIGEAQHSLNNALRTVLIGIHM